MGNGTEQASISFVSTASQLNKVLMDHSKNDLYLPSEEIAALHWSYGQDFIPANADTNVFIAAFTTAHARLRLYDEIEKMGDAVLYMDTDSIIYESTGKNDPTLGNYLGDFTDELGGDFITSFVSGDPKSYAFTTQAGNTCCKMKGFS